MPDQTSNEIIAVCFAGEPEPVVKCISGTPTIIETLMKERLEFSISPQAFFQINTEGAEKVISEYLSHCSICFILQPRIVLHKSTIHKFEVLRQVYEVVGEIAGLDKETVLLDVCCGTGTIGLCLAAKCKQVRNVLQTILKGNT